MVTEEPSASEGELRNSGHSCQGVPAYSLSAGKGEEHPQNGTSREEIPWMSHEEKGKIDAVVQPWLLKGDYIITC